MMAALGTAGSLLAQQSFDTPANVVFAVVAVFMIVAALRVVTTDNVVHAALWLVVVLGGAGINYLVLQAEFVGITQILVYLGAIIVLFLFGVMLTRAPLGKADDLDNNQRPIGIAVGAITLAGDTAGLESHQHRRGHGDNRRSRGRRRAAARAAMPRRPRRACGPSTGCRSPAGARVRAGSTPR